MTRIASKKNIVLVIALTTALTAYAQTAADESIAKDAANWEAKAKVETSKKAIADAKFPKLDFTPVSGEAKNDGDLTENSLLAYCALRDATKSVAARMAQLQSSHKPINRILLLSNPDVQALLSLQTVLFALENLEKGYEEIEKEANRIPRPGVRSLAVPAAIALGGLALQVATLFRTNTSLTGKNVMLDEMTVLNAMRDALLENTVTVNKPIVWSSSIGFGIKSASGLKQAGFYKRIYDINENERKRIDQTLLEREANYPADDKANAALVKWIAAVRSRFIALNLELDTLVSGITKADETGQTALQTLLKAEAIEKVRTQADTWILTLKAVALGGNNLTTQNFFTTRLYHSGGTLLTYEVYDHTGLQLAGSTVPAHTGYVRFTRHDANSLSAARKTELPPGCLVR